VAIVAGIDEAGLGPVLGPLVVSASAFRVPDELVDVPLWRLLCGVVARKPGRRKSRVSIGDSKDVYVSGRPDRLAHLERGVLAMLATRQEPPASLRALLNLLAPRTAEKLRSYPWYADGDLPLPRSVDAMGLRLSANALKRAMAKAGLRLEAACCEPVFAGEYNRLLEVVRNKSSAALNVTCRMLSWLWNRFDGDLRVVVDRQGARMRYLPVLELLFEDCSLKVLDESDRRSAYRLGDGRRSMEVHFLVEADRCELPTAYASMLSKYVRELFMSLFNGFWIRHVPDVVPTAGYARDGKRFYAEIRPAVQRLGLSEQMIYRYR